MTDMFTAFAIIAEIVIAIMCVVTGVMMAQMPGLLWHGLVVIWFLIAGLALVAAWDIWRTR
jgi:hypothetical protein